MPAWSLSARRAWIEIVTESTGKSSSRTSLSARRAWIEIGKIHAKNSLTGVALRKESVDRNLVIHIRVCAGHNVALRKESVECFSF